MDRFLACFDSKRVGFAAGLFVNTKLCAFLISGVYGKATLQINRTNQTISEKERLGGSNMDYYHMTARSNLSSISVHGLIP